MGNLNKKIYDWLKRNPELKRKVHYCLVHPYRTRPRLWVRILLMPFLIKRGKGSFISSTVRRDLYPFHNFEIGRKSIIEDYATLNNGMGFIKIGDYSRIGIGTIILGEITIGSHVLIGHHCVITGLNHNFENINIPFDEQGVYSDPIIIEDDVGINSNVIIHAGVRIGKHSVISAGSVVTRSVPEYTMVSGNPAKVIFDLKKGKRVNNN